MVSVIDVSMGEMNGQKANAPSGSKRQRDIILNMSDGSQIKSGSGWQVWSSEGTHYHLGGCRKPRGGEGKPTIYRLRTKWEEQEIGKGMTVPGPRGPGWIKASDQSHAQILYKLLGSNK